MRHRIGVLFAAALLALAGALPLEAASGGGTTPSLYGVIREGAVPGRTGLSFHNLNYRFDCLYVSITNSTAQNVIFGGTMVFLDRHQRTLARAEILPEKIKRRSTRRYRAVFVEGSGETAANASSLVWEFNQRNN